MNHPSDRFAAAVAHCLNSESSHVVNVEPGALYAALIDLLAARYAERLLHHPAYASRMSEEEAATRYFDATIARPLMLSGSVQLSVAHRLFDAMCRRGAAQVWRDCGVARVASPVSTAPVPAAPVPAAPLPAAASVPLSTAAQDPTAARSRGDVVQVSRGLAKLSQHTSPGSASPTIRARHGPIQLRVGTQHLPVPEEMSAWDAITCGPAVINALAPGEAFNRFCSVMIDCVRTANRPVQEILGLGRRLCPFDWLETLSVQQMRALKRFLRLLKETDAGDSPQSWAAAFAQAPVSGFKTAAALWDSEIGAALRNATGGVTVSLDELPELKDSRDDIGEFLGEQDFRRQLDLLEQDRILDPAERRLLGELYQGRELADAAQGPHVRALLKRRGQNLEQLLTDIQRRVDAWRQSDEDDDTSGDNDDNA